MLRICTAFGRTGAMKIGNQRHHILECPLRPRREESEDLSEP